MIAKDILEIFDFKVDGKKRTGERERVGKINGKEKGKTRCLKSPRGAQARAQARPRGKNHPPESGGILLLTIEGAYGLSYAEAALTDVGEIIQS